MMDGWLMKRSDPTLASLKWGERYFTLKDNKLSYSIKNTDKEPKGIYNLTAACFVSQIQTDRSNSPPYYIFSISWPVELSNTQQQQQLSLSENATRPVGDSITGAKKVMKNHDIKASSKNSLSKLKLAFITLGSVIFGTLTGGLGLLAIMAVLGGQYSRRSNNKKINKGGRKIVLNSDNMKQVILACDNYRDAELWVRAIEYQIELLKDLSDASETTSPINSFSQILSRKNAVFSPEHRLNETELWLSTANFKFYNVYKGIRILEFDSGHSESSTSSDSCDYNPVFRTNISINGSVPEVFTIISDLSYGVKSGGMKLARIIEKINNYSDIIHIIFEPIFLKPTWTFPRDIVLRRQWKRLENGSIIISLDSTDHADCPVSSECVRAEMHAVYLISPSVEVGGLDSSIHSECQLSVIMQCDPKGWIWDNYGFKNLFLQEIMLHALDIRDCVDLARFVKIKLEKTEALSAISSNNNNNNNNNSNNNKSPDSNGTTAVSENREITLDVDGPSPILPKEMWSDIDASEFKLRGKTYCTDKIKAVSEKQLFKLVALDLIESAEPNYNVAAHPRNRVFLAHQRGEKFWCYLVNIMIPGTPNLNFVAYYIGDKSLFDANTPFAKIAKQFFFGNDNDFRNSRFKLIPKVVDGNRLVRSAVKDTPTLLGTKLTQHYTRESHYFELAVDVASSTVAKYTVGIASTYAKTLIVDMAYCLEGRDEEELPEVLMGGVRCVNIDLKLAKKM